MAQSLTQMRVEKQSGEKELNVRNGAAGVQEKSEWDNKLSGINFANYRAPQFIIPLLLVASFSFVTFLLDEQKKSKRLD